MFFDTHAHYDDKQFDVDRDELLSSMPSNGIQLIVNPASDLSSSLAGCELAEKYCFVYFAAGVHPHEADSANESVLKHIQTLLSHPKCVALGEIGLDYHYDFSPRDVQKKVFRDQMAIAQDIGKTVIVHEREACADCLDIVKDFPDVKGVFHCFSGSWETARALLDIGWYLSFGGAVTFKNARKPVEVVAKMPLDRLLLETDCPYMAPVPHRGKRNSSLYLNFISKKIADIRGMLSEEIADITYENGKHLFGIS